MNIPRERPAASMGMQPVWKLYHDAQVDGHPSIFQPHISKKAQKVHDWIELIVMKDQPLSIVEDEIFRKHVPGKHARATMRGWIIKLADIVGLLIQKEIGKGNCISDGWSSGGYHYCAVIHRWLFRFKGQIIVKEALLSMMPLIDETDYGAASNADSINAVYEMYLSPEEKDAGVEADDLIVAFTLDNCNTNGAMVGCHFTAPMIAAMCHRLNLAFNAWVKEAFGGNVQAALDAIHGVMKYAGTLKGRGALRQANSKYQPCIKNATRWNGNAAMVIQYQLMEGDFRKSDYFLQVDNATEVEIPDGVGTKKITPRLLAGSAKADFHSTYVPAMKEAKMWIAEIQAADVDMGDATCILNSCRTSNLLGGGISNEFESRLLPDHSLVRHPDFELGVVKIMMQRENQMTFDEQHACRGLLRTAWPGLYPREDMVEDEGVDDGPCSPQEFQRRKAEKKRKHEQMLDKQQQSLYVDCSFLSPTTVPVERFFSGCGRVLSADRRLMHPRLFKGLMSLRSNRGYWDEKLVQDMLAGHWDELLAAEYLEEDFEPQEASDDW